MKTVLTQLRDTLLELSTTMEIITDHDKGYQECLINLAHDIEVQQLGYEREMIEKVREKAYQDGKDNAYAHYTGNPIY